MRRRFREWEHVPEGWARARAGSVLRGWDVESVVAAYRARVDEFRGLAVGSDPMGVSTSAAVGGGAPNVPEQNSLLVFGLALALASRDRDRVRVLDWGGGFGYHAFIGRALLPDAVALDYRCRELPGICAAAREAVPTVHFTDSDACFDHTYDLVMASNALQYAEDWASVVERLAGATERYLLLKAVPVVAAVPSFVVLQRTQRRRFDTEYLSWVFSREELVRTVVRTGLRLERQFLEAFRPTVHRAPEPPRTQAFLFVRP